MKKSIALGYNRERDIAPRILAKAKGPMAEAINRLAESEGIPVVEQTALSEVLYNLELQETIPYELYEIVSQIFAFVYHEGSDK